MPPRNDSGTGGTAGTAGAGLSPENLAKFVGGAKVGAPKPIRRPWDGLDPDAPRDKGMNFRTNPYERLLLRYVAGLRSISVQELIHELVRDGALAELKRREG